MDNILSSQNVAWNVAGLNSHYDLQYDFNITLYVVSFGLVLKTLPPTRCFVSTSLRTLQHASYACALNTTGRVCCIHFVAMQAEEEAVRQSTNVLILTQHIFIFFVHHRKNVGRTNWDSNDFGWSIWPLKPRKKRRMIIKRVINIVCLINTKS